MIIVILYQVNEKYFSVPDSISTPLDPDLQKLISDHAAAIGAGRKHHLLTEIDLQKFGASFLGLADSADLFYYAGNAEFTEKLLPLANDLIILKADAGKTRSGVSRACFSLGQLRGSGFQPVPPQAIIPGSKNENFTCWQRLPAHQLLAHLTQEGECDLHLHTNCSDGTSTPEELVDRVLDHGLKAFAVTDHDTIAAIGPARSYLQQKTGGDPYPMLIPGIEISVDYGGELHLLGYFPYGGYDNLQDLILAQQTSRERRNELMIERLCELGYDISMDMFKATGDGTIGRLQAAQLLVASGHMDNVQSAFNQLLNPGTPAYIERKRPDIAEAIWQIRKSGGAAVLAHPQLYDWCSGNNFAGEVLLEKLSALRQAGLQGVEAFHGEADEMTGREIAAAGKALGLVRTAGSDDHGTNKQRTSMYSAGKSWLPDNEILVAAALVNGPEKNGEPTWLIARRAEPGFGNGLWEVPGGKVEPGETSSAALEREIEEELAVKVSVGRIRLVFSYDYPDRRVVLVLHEAHISDTWQLRVHDNIGCYTAGEALALPLLPADYILFRHLEKIRNS